MTAYKFAEVRRSRVHHETWYARSDDAEQDALLRDHAGPRRVCMQRLVETLGVWPHDMEWRKAHDGCVEAWTKAAES